MYKRYAYDRRSKKATEIQFTYRVTNPHIVNWLTNSDCEEISRKVAEVIRKETNRRAEMNAITFYFEEADENWQFR